MNQRTDFDDWAADYVELAQKNVSFFDKDVTYFAEYKVRLIRNMVDLVGGRILDFGCGVGQSIPFFYRYFPMSRIVGCDISRRSLETAGRRIPSAEFFHPEELPPELRFDLIFSAGVFHHIPPQDRPKTVEFCRSRLANNGTLVIFEHNPCNPVTRRLVASCAFDKDASLLKRKRLAGLLAAAQLERIRWGYTLFFPVTLRLLGPLERYLERIPLGGQYYVLGHNPG